jgi:hypothetical protein
MIAINVLRLGTTRRVAKIFIVVPVRNEEHDLAPGIRRLVGYLRESFAFTARVTIADNGRRDGAGAAGHLVGQRRRGPLGHGCRLVD